MATANGDGSLTREVLRAELRAGLADQRNAIYDELDRRLTPINEHIQRIDRGEFTDAQQAGILKAIDESKGAKAMRRSLLAPIIAVGISLLSLGVTIVVMLATVGIIGVGPAAGGP